MTPTKVGGYSILPLSRRIDNANPARPFDHGVGWIVYVFAAFTRIVQL